MPSTGNKYCEATILQITRVVAASDRLYSCMAEFPDYPAAWEKYISEVDSALEDCPGTSAHYHKQQSTKDTGN